ncbi:hypothetical protein BDV19DRAFT_361010 [Aspergillus venezuelensis]
MDPCVAMSFILAPVTPRPNKKVKASPRRGPSSLLGDMNRRISAPRELFLLKQDAIAGVNPAVQMPEMDWEWRSRHHCRHIGIAKTGLLFRGNGKQKIFKHAVLPRKTEYLTDGIRYVIPSHP